MHIHLNSYSIKHITSSNYLYTYLKRDFLVLTHHLKTIVIRDDFLGPVCRFNVGSDSAVAPDRMGLQGVDPRGHLLQLLARTLRHHGRYKTSIIFNHQLCNILKDMFVNTTSSWQVHIVRSGERCLWTVRQNGCLSIIFFSISRVEWVFIFAS